MTQMVRKQIYIAKHQDAQLKRLAKARGVSEAEIIREAIEHRLNNRFQRAPHLDVEAGEKALAFMRALHAMGPLPNQRRTWKREDAYEERLSRYDRRTH